MARILLAWELGAGLGHLVPLADVGRELAADGHDCAYALRDLGDAHAVLHAGNTQLFQSPILLPERRSGNKAHTYADILANIGYRDASTLAGHVSAWRRIYEIFKPDLLVLDHAPTAQLAARGLGIPSIIIARSGFTIPPVTTPLPEMRAAEPDDPGERSAREKTVCDVINATLEFLQAPLIEHVGQLFETEARILLSIPEIDPYGPRNDVEYWGPLAHEQGDEPAWPAQAGKKIFGYVRNFRSRDALLHSIAASANPAIVHVSGMTAMECTRRSTASMRLSPTLLNVRRALEECDLVVTHGGSLVTYALLAGKPLLILPLHLEQQQTADRVAALGAGLSAPRLAPDGMHHKLHELLEDDRFAKVARQFAERYPQYPAPLAGRFAKQVNAILNC